MEKEIIIKPSFDIKSTFKASLFVGIGNINKYLLYFAFMVLLYAISYFETDKKLKKITIGWFPFILIFPMLIIFTIYAHYKNSKSQIEKNPRIKEDITFILTEDFFQEKGESFDLKHYWKNLYQIVEKKDIFLIYTLKNKALLIKKSDLIDNQYQEIKELFNSLNIKKSLIN